MRTILIGGAWPYANGPLHIGHIASLLPGDVLARYHRAAGDRVCYVSGSDCHGTPVALRAKQEGRTPQEVSDFYHEGFVRDFEGLGFSYDAYLKTSSPEHRAFVQEFHKKLYESGYVYEKETPQAYCSSCNTFLADRFVTGKCPHCGADTRGDQCDACGTILEPENLVDPICAVCKKPVEFRNSKHLYLAVSRMEAELRALAASPLWRKNAVSFTERYIGEGLRDRALTRDLAWGIPVPKDGYEEKTIYIWAENVLGYLSMSQVASPREEDFRELWGPDAKHYYVHGKDNIPFHTIILPALLIANGEGWHLPDQIVSSEYVTLEGRKISTSQNYAIWAHDLLERYEPDSIRYYFLANGPEKRDADFSWREFVNSHNGELLGAYGNFINRTFAFITRYLDGVVPGREDRCADDENECQAVHIQDGDAPEKDSDNENQHRIALLYETVAQKIEAGEFREALRQIFDFVHFANKYFDSAQPWVTRTSDPQACAATIYECVQFAANLAVVLYPFLPFSSEKVCGWLGIDHAWHPHRIEPGYYLPPTDILFRRLDRKVVDEELERLKAVCS